MRSLPPGKLLTGPRSRSTQRHDSVIFSVLTIGVLVHRGYSLRWNRSIHPSDTTSSREGGDGGGTAFTSSTSRTPARCPAQQALYNASNQ